MLQMITDVSHPIGMEATYERTTTNIITTTTNIGVLLHTHYPINCSTFNQDHQLEKGT